MNPDVVTVHINENLDDVMKKFGYFNLDEFPVISSSDEKHIVGSIWQHDVIEVYNKQIFLRDMSGELEGGIRKTSKQKLVPVFEKYHLIEIEAPNLFIDKTLRELNMRSQYGVDVILVKQQQKSESSTSFQPDANYKIKMGDHLLVFGLKDFLERLQKI